MNGTHQVVIKSLHGHVRVRVQRLLDGEQGRRSNYFELTGQFSDGYLTPRLQEWSAYYSNRLSYEEVSKLLARVSGERVLSGQRIEQLVIKRQKAQRHRKNAQEGVESCSAVPSPKRVMSDIALLQCRGGHCQYLCEGIDAQGQCVVSLQQRVRQALEAEYGNQNQRLNVVAISDGASHIRQSLQTIFGSMPTVILDGYHLCKKVRELMSMIAINKVDKERHLSEMLSQLWSGAVEAVLSYLRTEVEVRNTAKHEELITYLDKHRHEIIDYEQRQSIGKPIGSGRMEKGVDQVIGHRQKKKGMAWSAKGSKALAILKVVGLNGQWLSLWFPQRQQALEAAA